MSAVPLKAWLEKDGALLRLRLSRPKANIVDAAMIAGLRSALREPLPGGRPRGLLPAAGADRPGSRGGPPLLGARHRGGGGAPARLGGRAGRRPFAGRARLVRGASRAAKRRLPAVRRARRPRGLRGTDPGEARRSGAVVPRRVDGHPRRRGRVDGLHRQTPREVGRPLRRCTSMPKPVFVGLDIGSSRTKVAVVDAAKRLLGHAVRKSGTDFSLTAEACLDESLRMAGVGRGGIAHAVSTGYGRTNVAFVTGECKTEIGCRAKACSHYFPEAITVIDIGGQDNKVIKLDEGGRRSSFKMNRKCAAGAGALLQGASPGPRDPPTDRIVMTGGVVAHNPYIVRMAEEMTGRPVMLPEYPQLAGAIGAAFYALEVKTNG